MDSEVLFDPSDCDEGIQINSSHIKAKMLSGNLNLGGFEAN